MATTHLANTVAVRSNLAKCSFVHVNEVNHKKRSPELMPAGKQADCARIKRRWLPSRVLHPGGKLVHHTYS